MQLSIWLGHKPHKKGRAETPNDKITNPRGRRALTHWSVVDKVQVPKGLPEGDYVKYLSPLT